MGKEVKIETIGTEIEDNGDFTITFIATTD